MSDEEELEDFDFNEEDMYRAMNPGFRRNKMSKEEAMLGIWASKNSDSDDDDNDKFNYKNQMKSNKGNINFISSGVAGSKKAKIEQNEVDEDMDENNKDDKISDDDDDYGFSNKSKNQKKVS
jgi:hypothetical protein